MLIVRAPFARGLKIVLVASPKGLFSVAAPLAPFVLHVSKRRGSRRARRYPWLRRAAGGRCCSPPASRRAARRAGGAVVYRPVCVRFSTHDSDVESIGGPMNRLAGAKPARANHSGAGRTVGCSWRRRKTKSKMAVFSPVLTPWPLK